MTTKAKDREKKHRGVFEHPPGSKVFWINYYANGKRHREKVGNKSAAIELYRQRKADARRGVKLPELRNSRVVTISDLIEDVLEFTAHHKDKRSYVSKAKIIRATDLAKADASSLTPQEIERWLRSHCKTPATSNRYKAFISLCYREGLKNGKVQSNPARLLRQRKETNTRLRFLSEDEYKRLHAIIADKYPEHLTAFVVSVHTGMRLGEQFSVTWSQVHLDRRTIELTDSKNGSKRTVHLNSNAVEALRGIRNDQKGSEVVFPTPMADYTQREWFIPTLREAEIADYTWHSNRHTFCSWLSMKGASIKDIQELAGHKTIAMSARYAHLATEHKLSAVELISQ
jgi:integrase